MVCGAIYLSILNTKGNSKEWQVVRPGQTFFDFKRLSLNYEYTIYRIRPQNSEKNNIPPEHLKK